MAGLLDMPQGAGGLLAGPAPQKAYGGLLGDIVDWWRSQPSVLDQMRAVDALRAHTGDPLADFRVDAHNPALRAATNDMATNFNMLGALRSHRIPTAMGRAATVFEDANYADAQRVAQNAKYKTVRGFRDPESGKHYVWSADDVTHDYAIEQLGFDPAKIPDSALWWADIDELPALAKSLGLRGAP